MYEQRQRLVHLDPTRPPRVGQVLLRSHLEAGRLTDRPSNALVFVLMAVGLAVSSLAVGWALL